MERRKEENIGNVIMRFLRQSQLESPLNEYRLMQAWSEIVSSSIYQQTRQLSIRNQTLHVSLASAAIRTELFMRRAEIVRQLNQKVGAQVITDIALS